LLRKQRKTLGGYFFLPHPVCKCFASQPMAVQDMIEQTVYMRITSKNRPSQNEQTCSSVARSRVLAWICDHMLSWPQLWYAYSLHPIMYVPYPQHLTERGREKESDLFWKCAFTRVKSHKLHSPDSSLLCLFTSTVRKTKIKEAVSNDQQCTDLLLSDQQKQY